MMGVERTEIRSRPNAINSKADKGVAGRSMLMAEDSWELRLENEVV